jgi:hypothetical protein
LLILFHAGTFFAQSTPDNQVVSTAPIRKDPRYAHPQAALKGVVDERGKQGRNTFYVSRVYYFGNGGNLAWVYWREGRAIILWEPDPSGANRKHELLWSRRFLSLDKDVVAREQDIGGSSYLESREWARHTIHDCTRHGSRFVIYRSSRRHRQFIR